RQVLLEVCREAKETLRPQTRRLLIDLGPLLGRIMEPIVLNTADIYARCQPIVDRTLAMVARVFANLRECRSQRGDIQPIDPDNPRELGGLYLVGGSISFPLVARALRNHYKRKIHLAPEPYAATAIGLAISADPRAGLSIAEATTRHFGVWREADSGREKIFDPVFSKNTLPERDSALVVQRHYRPRHAVGHLRFLECTGLTDDGQPAGDLTPWREIHFPYSADLAERADLTDLPIERRGATTDEIAETYTYDPRGQIAVAISNRTRGYQRTFVLGTLR
ncbi:MAG: hypothetical protein AAGC55_19540, partial [Myxococcota bacterium]